MKLSLRVHLLKSVAVGLTLASDKSLFGFKEKSRCHWFVEFKSEDDCLAAEEE